jgi:hypothetical protein
MNVPDKTVKIISLDEENRLSPNDPNVIVGTCLLPPIESLIAEADGDEDLYDMYYVNHLNSPFPQEFVGALMAALYRGTSLLLYAPMLKENLAISKLRKFMFILYGIGIGVVGGDQCQYDPKCIPIWLNMIYCANVICAEEFLINYPEDAAFISNVIDKLLWDLKPVGDSYDSRLSTIREYQLRLKKKPNTQQVLYDIR